MADLNITNMNQGGIVISDPVFEDATLNFAAADTVIAGTILGKVTASGKYVPCNPAGSDGSEVPKAILTIDSARASAGDNSVRALVGGKVRRNKILFKNGTTFTNVHADQLRDYGINVIAVTELGKQDNQ